MQKKWCVGIVGSGKMGSNIAEYLIEFDMRIIWVVHTVAACDEKNTLLRKRLSRKVKNGALTAGDAEKKENDLLITTDSNCLAGTDIILECISENMSAKQELFRILSLIIHESTVCLSNTSSLPLDKVFTGLAHARCAGLHFFCPVQLKKNVEINVLPDTSENVKDTINKFVQYINCVPIVLEQPDHFALNRIFLPFFAQACRCIKNYDLTINEIDGAVESEMFPTGPFRFMESVGIGVMSESVVQYTKGNVSCELYDPLKQLLCGVLAANQDEKRKVCFDRRDAVTDSDTCKENKIKTENIQKAILCMKAVFVNTFFTEVSKKYTAYRTLATAVSEYIGLSDSNVKALLESPGVEIADTLQNLYSINGYEEYRMVSLLNETISRQACTRGLS